MSESSIFSRIYRGEIPSEIIAETENVFAIRDIAPQAPVHLLVIPKTGEYRDVVELAGHEGAQLVVDGRDFVLEGHENGFFSGATLFDNVTPEMKIYREEIFGPVVIVVRAHDYEEALRLPSEHEYGNGVAIFTRDGDTARDFASRCNIGMVGINVPIPVPLAYYTFGGWKRSAFGDLNQHGPDSIRFYTKTKTVTARWPSGIKDGASFVIPTMG